MNADLSELTDAEIVNQMRKVNYEKYKTLVRMHLSFELDLNTDEFDLPCHEIVYKDDKGKFKKWNRFSKKHRSTTTGCATTRNTGNSPIDVIQNQIDAGFLIHLKELKEFLMLEKNLKQEGIFRKTGSAKRQNELRLIIQNDKPLNLEASGYSAHDCATVFKSYLAELNEPLLSDAHYPAHLQIAPLCIGITFQSCNSTFNKPLNPERIKREEHLLNSMQLLLLLLPEENRSLLGHVIDILHAVSNLEHENKMSANNLATLFAPHLICPRNIPPEALHYVSKKMSSILAYMIQKGEEIFDVPSKLSTDIRAYLLDRKRKKTMSPEKTLDDSISDMSTVNTVYTFVDRERTAAAHNTNTTDTELAQLYAHIQSLPESSKKRRLIKQFNKQNGQGTPLQLIIMNRIKNSDATRSAKSFGDSIKKHIFHKGLMSRTPKRTDPRYTYTANLETPNSSNTKHPKLRVLFRSPTPSSCSNARTETPELAPRTSASATINTPYILKSHPLQKSISSSSVLLNSSARIAHNHHNLNTNICSDENESSSSDDCLPPTNLTKLGCSTSAPVSRQTSRELPKMNMTFKGFNSSSSLSSPTASLHQFQVSDPNCFGKPLRLTSEAAKQFTSSGDRNYTNSDEHLLLEADENTSYPQNNCEADLSDNLRENIKSRYKSEPNLSRILKEKLPNIPKSVPEQDEAKSVARKSLTLKLIKGVSMGNLKFPFSSSESTKRIVQIDSSTIKRRHSDDSTNSICTAHLSGNKHVQISEAPLIESVNLDDLDDDTFEDDPNDNLDSESETDGTLELINIGSNSISTNLPETSSSVGYDRILVQPSGLYRNIDLITSTPSVLLGRRSMSPITKSAQRMPKSMQESIMTPRSRKPVMVLTTTLGSSDTNQTVYQTDLSSFREQDEDVASDLYCKNVDSIDRCTEIIQNRQRRSEQMHTPSLSSNDEHEIEEHFKDVSVKITDSEALSEHFKQYLLKRSVFSASPPIDESFSSQPEDFTNEDINEDSKTTPELMDLNESQLSPSLLYCLNGNEPTDEDVEAKSNVKLGKFNVDNFSTPNKRVSGLSSREARKRAASHDLKKQTQKLSPTRSNESHNKDNQKHAENYVSTKKILISDFPNETSF